jgi:hypothetical protein
MVRHRGHSFNARIRRTSVGRDKDTREWALHEKSALQRRWGVASCDRCGRTIVLGEPLARLFLRGREVVLCPECVEPAPAAPTWITAPERHGRAPVRLVEPQRELQRAA